MKVRGFNNNSQNGKFSNASAATNTYEIELTGSGLTIACTVTVEQGRGTTFSIGNDAQGVAARLIDNTVVCDIGGNAVLVTPKLPTLVYNITEEIGLNDEFTFGGDVMGGTAGNFVEFSGAFGDALTEAIDNGLEITQLDVTECGDSLSFKMLGLPDFLTAVPSFIAGVQVQIFLELTVVYPSFEFVFPLMSVGTVSASGLPSIVNNTAQSFTSNGIDNFIIENADPADVDAVLQANPIYYSFQFINADGVNLGSPQTINATGNAAYECDTSQAVLGCTYTDAENYNSAATQDDGSCTFADGGGYDGGGDVEVEVYGCTDDTAVTFDPLATVDDGSCQYYTAQGDPVGDATGLITALGLTNSNYGDLINDTIYLIQQLQADLDSAMSTQEDGVNQADVDAVQAQLNAANEQLTQLQGADAMLSAVEDTIADIASAPCDLEDPTTSAKFDALDAAGVGADTIAALNTLCTANDNITQADVAAATNDLEDALDIIDSIWDNTNPDNDSADADTSNMSTLEGSINAAIDALWANQEDGIGQADVDAANAAAAEAAAAAQANLDAANASVADLEAQLEAAMANQEDGVSQADVDAVQADLDAANADVADLEAQLADAIAATEAATSAGADALAALQDEYDAAIIAAEEQFNADLDAGLSTAEADYNAALDALDAEYDAALADLEATQATALQDLSATQAAALAAAEADYNAALDSLEAEQDAALADALAEYETALDLQEGELDAINDELQTQIDTLTDQVPLDAAAAADAQQTALDNLQAQFDALGLVYTEQEMIDLIQAAEDGITPEDGVTAETVLAAEAALQAIIDTMFTQGDLDATELAATQAAEQVAADAAADLAAITAQNITDAQDAYDAAILALEATQTEALTAAQADYDAALLDAQGVSFQDGVDSVDITTDNAGVIADAMSALAEGDPTYDTIFGEGAASSNPELADLQAALDAANAAISSGDSGAAIDFLNTELDLAAAQLADAQASNAAWGDFLSTLDTSMSRLERFLADSYSYENYDRSTLSIPEDMSVENPNFDNETPSMTSIYVGDGTDFGNTTSYEAGVASGYFGEFSGGGEKKVNSITSFSYMMGRANHIQEGFMNYSGELPFSRMDGDEDEEEGGIELTSGTKTGLWIFGGALAAFGLYKVLKKK
jgi:hypothetical protein